MFKPSYLILFLFIAGITSGPVFAQTTAACGPAARHYNAGDSYPAGAFCTRGDIMPSGSPADPRYLGGLSSWYCKVPGETWAVACSATRGGDGVCGGRARNHRLDETAYSQYENYCSQGTVVPNIPYPSFPNQYGSVSWTCEGWQGGNNSSCTASRSAQPYTATPTHTPQVTATLAATVTFTPTFTATFTASSTSTATATPTATLTQTSTPAPTPFLRLNANPYSVPSGLTTTLTITEVTNLEESDDCELEPKSLIATDCLSVANCTSPGAASQPLSANTIFSIKCTNELEAVATSNVLVVVESPTPLPSNTPTATLPPGSVRRILLR